MLTTILFDLDGTLLPLNMDKFIEAYFKGICTKLKDYFEPKELSRLVWEATNKMIESNDQEKSNEEVFFEYFYKKTTHRPEEINPIFEDFYVNEFVRLKEITRENPLIIEGVRILKDKGYNLVVATNPLFPKRAITHRIEWAGLDQEDFIFITSFENMHFCKPKIEYYREILTYIDKKPTECMMVGNDVEEDMISKEIGLQTFLIEDHVIQRENNIQNVDYKGNYEDFLKFAIELPKRS